MSEEEAKSEDEETSPEQKLEFDEQAFEDALGASPMDEDAVQMHELFLSLMRAGFLEHQALRLVAFLIDQAQDDIVITTDDEDDDD